MTARPVALGVLAIGPLIGGSMAPVDVSLIGLGAALLAWALRARRRATKGAQ